MTTTLTIEDTLAIRDLAAAYAEHVDRRTFDGLHDVFTPDAVLVPGESERRGIEQILTAMESLDRYEATFHFVGQHRIRVDADGEVRGEAYCKAHHVHERDGQKTDRVMFIRYQDHYVRSEPGWRIARRELLVDWVDVRSL